MLSSVAALVFFCACLANLNHFHSNPSRQLLASSRQVSEQGPQSPIDTLSSWNGAQWVSPIGGSVNSPRYIAQTFRSSFFQNLESLRFVFRSAGTPPVTSQIETKVFEWDEVLKRLSGPLLWSTRGISANISSNDRNEIFYQTTGSSVRLAEEPAPNVVIATLPINAGLKPNTSYAVVFSSPFNALSGSGLAGATLGVYPDGAIYFSNSNATTASAVSDWEQIPETDFAFTLTFSKIVHCQGSWVSNPYWAQLPNPGSPPNCLETFCSNYPVSSAPGFLDEVYNITTSAGVNGMLCNASYGSVNLGLRNTNGNSFAYFRLFNACTQDIPCVNCGLGLTSRCYRTAPDISGVRCSAQADIVYPESSVVSTTSLPYPSAFPARAETQTPPVPVFCPASGVLDCPCVDCVTAWQDSGPCYQCDFGGFGVQDQVAVVVIQGSQLPIAPILFRSCALQSPSFPGFRQISCSCPPLSSAVSQSTTASTSASTTPFAATTSSRMSSTARTSASTFPLRTSTSTIRPTTLSTTPATQSTPLSVASSASQACAGGVSMVNVTLRNDGPSALLVSVRTTVPADAFLETNSLPGFCSR